MNLQERKSALQARGFNPSEYSDEEIMSLNPDKLRLSPDTNPVVQVDTPEPEMFLEERAPVKGRFAVKNLSGEDSEAAVQYLANQNPGVQFTQKDGRIFARPKNEKNWKALDPDTFEMEDISDVAFDVVSGLAQTAGMIAAGIPTGGIGGAIGGAATGYGTEKLRDYLGEMIGVRGGEDDSSAIPAAVIGAAVPGAGALARGAGSTIARLPGIETLTGIPKSAYQRLVKDRGFNKYAQLLQKDYNKAQEAIETFAEPVLQEFSKKKTQAGAALGSILSNIDRATAEMGFDGVSTKDLYSHVRKRMGELLPKVKTPEGKAQVAEIKQFVEQNFKDSKGDIIPFMNMKQLQSLKEVLRGAANFDTSTSNIKPGAGKAIDALVKSTENKITQIQDAWADQVIPKGKNQFKALRKAYANILDEEKVLAPLESPNFYTQASTLDKSTRTQLRSLMDKYIKGMPNEEQMRRNIDAIALSRAGQEVGGIPATLQGLIRSTIANPNLVSGLSSVGSELTYKTMKPRFGLLTGSTLMRESD
jgi:hypothetical protein